ncbi:S-layer homology domain-containing protein [bacterium]|nr:S-layer homology domain-containing protein [candidate division CSSED10-310 bacterium]
MKKRPTGIIPAMIIMTILFPGCRHISNRTEPHRNQFRHICSDPSWDLQSLCRGYVLEVCQFIDRQDLTGAEDVARQGLMDAPECHALRWLGALILMERNEIANAAISLRDLPIDIFPSPAHLDRYFEIIRHLANSLESAAMSYRLEDRLETAIQYLHLRNQLTPHPVKSVILEAKWTDEIGRPAEAARILQTIPENERTFEVLIRMGYLYMRITDYTSAESSFQAALNLNRDPEIERVLRSVREARLAQTLPPDLKSARSDPWISREDFVRLFDWRYNFPEAPAPLPVIIDITGCPSRDVIIRAVVYGLIDVRRDHRFRPKTKVRRIDLALACYRLGERMNLHAPYLYPRLPADISDSHYAAVPIRWCLGLDLISTDPDGAFRPGELITGEELFDSMERLDALITIW